MSRTIIAIGKGAGGAGGGVTTIAGTANQITASAPTGAVTLSIPATFIAPGSIQATTTYNGINGQTITGDANGAWTITANGTNQNVNLAPSGTGNVVLAGASGTSNYFLATQSSTGSVGFRMTRSGGANIDWLLYAPNSSQQLRFYNGSDRITIGVGGNLLLSGLTTDGTGVLQFPAATTSAGGITMGTDNFIYRAASTQMIIGPTGGTFTLEAATSSNIFGNQNDTKVFGNVNLTLGAGRSSSGTLTLQSGSTVTALTLDSSQNTQFAKLITSYNGIATAGNGVSTVQASGRATAQVAANASVSTYTVGAADASFLVFGNVLVTTATAHSFSMTCAYTDEGNTSRTVTLGFFQLTGATVITLITNVTGATPYESIPFPIRCKANTAITFATTGTFTTVVYNAEGFVVKNS